jgi:hypothetical protein
MTEIETRFHRAMVDLYQTAKRDCNYNATYFLRMVTDYGGLEAARKLLETDAPSDGFTTLFLCGRLDLTVEAHVIRPEYAELFTEQEIASARKRLVENGYTFDK